MDYCINSQYRKQKYTKDAQNHVPLDCTDNYWVYFKAAMSLAFTTKYNFQAITKASLRGLLRKRKEVFESSTVILTFPLISSIVPILSGLSILVSTVQCKLTWCSKSAGGSGGPTGYGRNEGWRRPHRQGSYQSRRGFC